MKYQKIVKNTDCLQKECLQNASCVTKVQKPI